MSLFATAQTLIVIKVTCSGHVLSVLKFHDSTALLLLFLLLSYRVFVPFLVLGRSFVVRLCTHTSIVATFYNQ